MNLKIVPCTLQQAKRFVDLHHRHHRAKIQAIFCVAVIDCDGIVRGVAMAGWPVARHMADRMTIEVNRVATDGCRNACSALLGACRRIAFAMGYRRIITYTLHDEGGASLRGSGWRLDSESAGGSSRLWNSRTGRSERDALPSAKCRWISVNPKANDNEPTWPKQTDVTRQGQLFAIKAPGGVL